MLAESTAGRKSLLKNPLIYSAAVLLIAALAVGVMMLARWQEARIRERAAEQERVEKQREGDRATVEMLGGKEFSILDFYLSPRAIHRGETAKLCYGVSNAKSVTLEPEGSAVWPSAANCVNVSPVKTTTYTLTIHDAAGHAKSDSLELVVR